MNAERHPLGRTCARSLPLALLLMPWALWRYWLDARPAGGGKQQKPPKPAKPPKGPRRPLGTPPT